MMVQRYTLDFSEFVNKEFVRKLNNRKFLFYRENSNVDALYTLRNLDFLSIDQPVRLDLSQFGNLTTLYITGDDKVKNIEALINLRHLLMTSTTHQDLTHLENLRNLETLEYVEGELQVYKVLKHLEI